MSRWAAMFSIVKASPVPRLFGCILRTKSPEYLASVYFLLMLYDGGKFSNLAKNYTKLY